MSTARRRNHDSHCVLCYQRREICICPIIPKVQTRTKFLILRHVQEENRPSNTGRLAALAMPNARIVACGGGNRIGGVSLEDELQLTQGTWLLWPDATGTRAGMTESPPEQVVVLDGTWRQARRLYSRMPILRSMPQMVLPVPALNRDRLRKQNRSDGMSTIEAIAAAVAKIEGADAAVPLERLFDEVVRRTLATRWGRNYKHPTFYAEG
jgi:DTW domain-containing protein